jgi:hypothetical protein
MMPETRALVACEMLNRVSRLTNEKLRIEFSASRFKGTSTIYFGSFGRKNSAHMRGSMYTGQCDPSHEEGTPGDGARVLRFVCRVADAFGVPIVLNTYNLGLVRYYRRFGFRVVDDSSSRWIEMTRTPRKARKPRAQRLAA